MTVCSSLAFMNLLLGMISVCAPKARTRLLAACVFLFSTTVAALHACLEVDDTLRLLEATIGLCALVPVLSVWIMLLCRHERLVR
jgi:hypothetical protein